MDKDNTKYSYIIKDNENKKRIKGEVNGLAELNSVIDNLSKDDIKTKHLIVKKVLS